MGEYSCKIIFNFKLISTYNILIHSLLFSVGSPNNELFFICNHLALA